jgi:hypothetical protein
MQFVFMKKYIPQISIGTGIFLTSFTAMMIDDSIGGHYFHPVTWLVFLRFGAVCSVGYFLGFLINAFVNRFL